MNFRATCFSFLFSGLILITASRANAQFNDYKTKFGIQVNGLVPYTEFETDMEKRGATYEPSYMGRLFVRIEVYKNIIESELGAGYGHLLGQDLEKDLEPWKTTLLPIDARVIISPFNLKLFDFSGYFGIGILRWRVIEKPVTKSPKTADQSGWTAFIPIGLNFNIKLTDNKFVEINCGYSYTFTDNINFYNNYDENNDATSNDGFMHLGVGLVFVGGSGLGDNDLDGLTNREEKDLGTDPENPDTENDGLKDGEEVKNYLTNPLNSDSDGDGLSDGDEINKYKTNPNNIDSDGDSLNDRVELNVYFTNPLSMHSDADNINDADEVLKYHTNPLITDSDTDKLNDGDEITIHNTDPLKIDSDDDSLNDFDEIALYKTNPLNVDSDSDSLNDNEEINLYKTNPLNPDSDGDGLKDSEEVKLHKTNPLLADTDGGSVNDFIEVQRGTNPLNPADDEIKINVPIVLDGITFEKQKAVITPESESVLLATLKTMETYPEMSVLIGGHTDNVGKTGTNQRLSQRRAEAVKAWLVSKGIDPSRITAVGFGEGSPRVPNDSEANKLLNRRVEFIRIK